MKLYVEAQATDSSGKFLQQNLLSGLEIPNTGVMRAKDG